MGGAIARSRLELGKDGKEHHWIYTLENVDRTLKNGFGILVILLEFRVGKHAVTSLAKLTSDV